MTAKKRRAIWASPGAAAGLPASAWSGSEGSTSRPVWAMTVTYGCNCWYDSTPVALGARSTTPTGERCAGEQPGCSIPGWSRARGRGPSGDTELAAEEHRERALAHAALPARDRDQLRPECRGPRGLEEMPLVSLLRRGADLNPIRRWRNPRKPTSAADSVPRR